MCLPLTFTENRGQLDHRIAFHVQGRDTAAYFTAQGMTLAFTGQRNTTAQPDSLTARLEPGRVQQRWNLKLDFLGANPNVRPEGRALTPTRISYFHGPQTASQTGRTDLPSYGEIVYRDLWPGIDLVYGGTVNRLKYQFVVRPGADPAQIRLAYRGPDAPLTINRSGQLEIVTPFGTLRDDKPVSAQGARDDIKTKFVLHGKTRDGGYEYGFRVGKYDRRQTLVIDPALLVYSGLIGGSGDDEGHSIAVDAQGNAYITGVTTSPAATFPETAGPDLTYNGRTDAFVAKIKADGSGLVYASYLGGEGDDEGHSIAVDAQGNAYVTGLTTSFETSFPVKGGPDVSFNGAMDAFVAKINPAGTALVYCGYVGGDDEDEGLGVAVDGQGRAYLTGLTASAPATFPEIIGPKLTFGGAVDAFVARVKADGSGLEYAGYLGGSGDDQGRSIAVDANGNAYIAGQTTSTATSFPMTGTLGATAKGGTDAFVAKINASGTGIAYSGFLGGSGNDEAYSIALDNTGAAYLTGRTTSSEATFPKVVGPDLTFNGLTDAFVAKINAAGAALSYAGYIGGSGEDEGFSIAVDSAGNAYVAGRTTSDVSFPKTNAFSSVRSGTSDAILAKINPTGTSLTYATFYGGSGREEAFGTAVDSLRNAYITGRTTSDTDFPKLLGPSLQFQGASEAFVAKVTDAAPGMTNPAPVLASLNPGFAVAGDPGFVLTVNGADFVAGSLVRWNNNPLPTKFVNSKQLTATIPTASIASAGTATITVFNPAPGGGTSNALSFVIHPDGGFEADVAPRPFGSRVASLTAADVVQSSRFALGLDKAAPGSEFQRADCAPRATLGDGRITLTDLVQTGRYFAGLDQIVKAGGPKAPVATSFAELASATTARTLRATNAAFPRGQIGTLQIELDAQGDENAVSFSLNYDPRLLRFLDANVGKGAAGATVEVSDIEAAHGRIGFVLVLDPGKALAAGTQSVLTLRFLPASGEGNVTTTINFSDQLLPREIADVNAAAIASVDYQSSTVTLSGRSAATVSAASYADAALAADSIASAFGTRLATITTEAISLPLPTVLGGTSVRLKDSQGVERMAPLFFVSAQQINYQIPANTAEGIATLTITNGAGEVTAGLLQVSKVSPGIFTADASGVGWAAADVVYVKSDQSQVLERVARYDAGQKTFVPVPIEVSTDVVVLTLYGTGIRHRADLSEVKIQIGGVEAEVDYADQQGQYLGLDQINVRVPSSLAGRGLVQIEIEIAGKAANPVNVQIK